MKDKIIADIIGQLGSMQISARQDQNSDIVISAEFLDASWSTGSKNIAYFASVFADERENTVFMYEKTTETGGGFSFGGDTSSSFQSGKTLFRKVKSVQYGPDGKAYEYTLDLGAITKAVRDAALRFGWKFKTVLKKEKAAYPSGYIPSAAPPSAAKQAGFCTGCGAPLEPGKAFCTVCGKAAGATEPANPAPPPSGYTQPPAYMPPAVPPLKNPRGKGRTPALAALFLLAAAAVILLLILETNIIGWVLSVIIIALTWVLLLKLKSKGCFTYLLLLFIAATLLFIVIIFATDTDTPSVSASGAFGKYYTSVALKTIKPVG